MGVQGAREIFCRNPRQFDSCSLTLAPIRYGEGDTPHSMASCLGIYCRFRRARRAIGLSRKFRPIGRTRRAVDKPRDVPLICMRARGLTRAYHSLETTFRDSLEGNITCSKVNLSCIISRKTEKRNLTFFNIFNIFVIKKSNMCQKL